MKKLIPNQTAQPGISTREFFNPEAAKRNRGTLWIPSCPSFRFILSDRPPGEDDPGLSSRAIDAGLDLDSSIFTSTVKRGEAFGATNQEEPLRAITIFCVRQLCARSSLRLSTAKPFGRFAAPGLPSG